MDFLKQEFLDQLRAEVDDATGNVLVESAQFTPQQILEFNSETFEMSFAEWSENKKQDRLDKADEILNLYDNKNRFKALKDSHNRGAVIPFVGAGLSIPSGYPSWTSYLNKILEETLLDPETLEGLLATAKYEEAAQLLYDNMKEGPFNEALANEFGGEFELSGAVRYLPYIFKNSVITTNFDDVIKRCYEDAGISFSDTLLGLEAKELPQLLGSNKKVLVKLHGKATAGRNRVLTLDEYNNHYTETDTLKNSIEAISNKTLLFLGCSLGADRTIDCLKSLLQEKGAESSVRHYTFAAIEDDQEKRLGRRDMLAEANIFPIWYSSEDDHDECIAALLEKLKDDEVNQ